MKLNSAESEKRLMQSPLMLLKAYKKPIIKRIYRLKLGIIQVPDKRIHPRISMTRETSRDSKNIFNFNQQLLTNKFSSCTDLWNSNKFSSRPFTGVANRNDTPIDEFKYIRESIKSQNSNKLRLSNPCNMHFQNELAKFSILHKNVINVNNMMTNLYNLSPVVNTYNKLNEKKDKVTNKKTMIINSPKIIANNNNNLKGIIKYTRKDLMKTTKEISINKKTKRKIVTFKRETVKDNKEDNSLDLSNIEAVNKFDNDSFEVKNEIIQLFKK